MEAVTSNAIAQTLLRQFKIDGIQPTKDLDPMVQA